MKTSNNEIPKGFFLRGYKHSGQEEKLISISDAKLSGDTLSFPFPEGFVPYELKYAWAPFPICNLILTIHWAEANMSKHRSRKALGFIYYAQKAREDKAAHAAYQKKLAEELSQKSKI